MIKSTETTEEIASFASRLPGGDLALMRIGCLAQAYGLDRPFLRAWTQWDGEKSTALLVAMDGSLSVSALSCADLDELAAFIRMAGCDGVFVRGELAAMLNLRIRESGVVLHRCADALSLSGKDTVVPWSPASPQARQGKEERRSGRADDFRKSHRIRAISDRRERYAVRDDVPSVDVYELLAQCEGAGIRLPGREAFCADFSHRVRHGCAHLAAVLLDGAPVSIALTTAEYHKDAVLGGAATVPEYRGQGLASAAIAALGERLRLGGLEVWTACADSLIPFYRRLGFVPADRFTLCEPDA